MNLVLAAKMDSGTVDFVVEVEQSLKEVAYAIEVGTLSGSLPSDPNCAYFNLTTKEKREMTVRLTLRGFEVSVQLHCC